MKKLSLIIVLCSLATACHYAANMHGPTGSGIRKVEKRELNPFTSISTDGAFEIEVVCQQPQSFEIEGDDNLLSMVSTQVANGVLRISPVGSYSVGRDLRTQLRRLV
jgi:Putative auto-transporter adhesin, head GIN domain